MADQPSFVSPDRAYRETLNPQHKPFKLFQLVRALNISDEPDGGGPGSTGNSDG
ncbi:hypothetical protein HK102_008170, partial [Quaeritorhiza haematococci]